MNSDSSNSNSIVARVKVLLLNKDEQEGTREQEGSDLNGVLPKDLKGAGESCCWSKALKAR